MTKDHEEKELEIIKLRIDQQFQDKVEQFRKDAIKNTDMSNVSDYSTFKFGEQTKYKNGIYDLKKSFT